MTYNPLWTQLGLFAGCDETPGVHTVAAHTRILHDGTEVFVAEHLRRNRPRRPRSLPPLKGPPPTDHPTLFDLPFRPAPTARPAWVMEEIEVLPGAFQLPLWATVSEGA